MYDRTNKKSNIGFYYSEKDIVHKFEYSENGLFLAIIGVIFAIICIFSAGAFLVYIVASTEKFDPEALKNQDQTIIYDKNGEIIAKLGDEKRESVTYNKLPQVNNFQYYRECLLK